nr:MAG TPA: hypothetical protein [Bacteriophage sp.]
MLGIYHTKCHICSLARFTSEINSARSEQYISQL